MQNPLKKPIKMLVTDMDGTLLNAYHKVSQANRLALKQCQKHGIEVVLASGRSFFSVGPQALELGLAGPQISLNGGMVAQASTGQLHSLRTLAKEKLEFIILKLESLGLVPIVFAGAGIYSCEKGEVTSLIESFGEPEITIVGRQDLEHIHNPVKVLVAVERGELDESLAREFGSDVLTIRTGAQFLEFQTPGVSKGAALKVLMDEKKIQGDEVIALGDNDNDVSLFEVAHWSFAVANATEAAKKAARFQSVSNEEDAVAKVLETYFSGGFQTI